MKIKTTIATLSLLSLITFGASAAELITTQQAGNLQSAGTISVSGTGGAPIDMRQALSQKADAQGASAYRVIEARTGDSWHATAELYK
ncbi:peroxide/acid stress response protein YhcN [Erwiniaceae bacterium BAC15a-03b]|uniref:Peroxide/acid stress response protein YhcN n=1 Tax=Winslowiella arboricola TaxID=2978220 RepID=A0A9J6PHG0_9GAMM|nr:peroxide/acid stress response protein YhcN [Winslowiella arboricola]MCU5773461.1 peroxide/acid stress response protein YhcN [Winslowiella arboricola]MCU5776786.1 peroxide/acid stress response protein YhcN [Winslowiella arboricola]